MCQKEEDIKHLMCQKEEDIKHLMCKKTQPKQLSTSQHKPVRTKTSGITSDTRLHANTLRLRLGHGNNRLGATPQPLKSHRKTNRK